jgi:hypothetical protein
LEAGPLSQWLFSALAEADLPVICVETRHMRAMLQAQINRTDRNDARGIAQMIRGWPLPTGACEDALQSEATDAAGPPQATAVESHCNRERFAHGEQVARRCGMKMAIVALTRARSGWVQLQPSYSNPGHAGAGFSGLGISWLGYR